MTEIERCPSCHGDLIVTDYNGERYSTVIGIVINSVYDGVLFYRCPTCRGAFHRFDHSHPLYEKADYYVERHNTRWAAPND